MEETAQTLTEYLLPLVVVVLTPVASGLGVLLYRKVASWLNVQVDEKQEQMLRQLVAEGTAYAEQQAMRWAKLRQKPATGDDKLEEALKFITAEAQRRGLPELARDALVAKVEAELGTTKRGLFIEATTTPPEGSQR